MIFCLDASFLGTRFSFSVGESGQVWPVTHPMGKPGLTSSQDHMASKGSWKGVLSLHLGASYMHNVPGGGGLAGLSGWKQPCSFLFLLQSWLDLDFCSRRGNKEPMLTSREHASLCTLFLVLDLEM